MGFTAENNKVTGIGLYKCGLSIGNLSSLKELDLSDNKLKTLPEPLST